MGEGAEGKKVRGRGRASAQNGADATQTCFQRDLQTRGKTIPKEEEKEEGQEEEWQEEKENKEQEEKRKREQQQH